MLHTLFNALEETLFMVFSAGLLTWIIGLPLAAFLSVLSTQQSSSVSFIYKPLSFVISIAHKVPYIGLMIALIPLTRFIMGTGEGSVAAILPLTLAAIPYFTQLCEKALNKVPRGLIEAAKAAGASPLQIIYKVLIPEALPNIILALTTTLTHLIGYSTMAGALGGGGLGSLMIHKGYQDFHSEYVIAAVILLIALIQIIQLCGDYIANGNLPNNSNA